MLVVDPAADGGRAERMLPAITERLGERGFRHRIDRPERAGDGERSARAALEAGSRFLVVLGDDTTVHEVLNGMVGPEGPVAAAAYLGILPSGPTCDFARTFGLPTDPVRAVPHLDGPNHYPLDVGTVECADEEGTTVTRRFALLSEVGLGGEVAARVGRPRQRASGARYFLAFWRAYLRYRRPRIHLRGGSTREFQGTVTNVVVGNCPWFGQGIKLSPRSWPGDGLLDLMLWVGPKSDAYTLLPKMFQGEHVPNPNIVEYRSRTVEVDAERRLRVHVDGHPLGFTPARFGLFRHAVRFKI